MIDLAEFFDDKASWSRATFGPADRAIGLCEHIREELIEIESDPACLEEWIDVVLLAMDGAWRSAGADGQAFVAALVAKDQRNRARTWSVPDDATKPTPHMEGP